MRHDPKNQSMEDSCFEAKENGLDLATDQTD